MQNAFPYHHLTVTDRDGCVETLTPAPADRTPRWAEGVADTPHGWAPPTDRPVFLPLIPFIIPPVEGSGEPFYSHNHCPASAWC